MHEKRSSHGKRSSHEKRPSHEEPSSWPGKQTPPEVKIALMDNQNPAVAQVKLVSTGNTVTGRTTYVNDTEYFFHKTSSPAFAYIRGLTCSTLDTTDTAIDEWVDKSNYTASFNHPRTGPTWTAGARTVRPGRTGHLFSATDPDDNTKRIGVLIEETSGVVNAVVYYKQTVGTSKQIWDTNPTSPLSLTAVTDANGRPDTDPTRIDGAGNWSGSWTLMGTP